MKFLTSFGFRVWLTVAAHLFGLVSLIASGQWIALVWLVVSSLWSAMAFMQELRADRWESVADRWRKVYEKEAFGVSRN